MKPKPYVGITGFKTEEEVSQLAFSLTMINEAKQGFSRYWDGDEDFDYGPAGRQVDDHTAMFGYIVSNKRLADMDSEGKVSPPASRLAILTQSTPDDILAMMHYFTPNRRELADEVKKLFSIEVKEWHSIGRMYENDYCRALQVNMAWPDIDQIEKIREEFPAMQIVLQLPAGAMEGQTAEQIVSRVREYGNLVKYCLIDPSGGEGKDVSIEAHAGLMGALDESLPNTTIGIAGGFSADNVAQRICSIDSTLGARKFCIDAQGKLRQDDGRSIDLKKAGVYLSKASHALKDAWGPGFY